MQLAVSCGNGSLAPPTSDSQKKVAAILDHVHKQRVNLTTDENNIVGHPRICLSIFIPLADCRAGKILKQKLSKYRM